ncbi:MAG TPA: MFS transporter [Cellulomonas sp.]
MTADADRPRAGLGWALGTGTILQGLNSSMIAVALVTIGSDLDVSTGVLAWAVSGLYVAAAVGAPLAGSLADAFGPRRLFLAGLAVVVVASVAGSLVRTGGALIATRVLLGLGASVHFPAAMAIVRHRSAATGDNPAPLIGIVSLCGQTTAALGPLVGAVIVTLGGWRGIYWVNLPVALVSCLTVLRTVPVDPPVPPRAERRRPDVGGVLGFVAWLTCLMLALSLAESGGTWWPWAVAGAALLAVFVGWERGRTAPFLDVRELAGNPVLVGVLARAVVTYLAFYTVFYGLPQWAERSGGMSTLASGTLMVPVFAAGAVATLVAARWGARTDPWRLLAVGAGCFVLGGAVLATGFRQEMGLAVAVGGAVLLGLPNGFNNVGNQLVLQNAVEPGRSGAATGMYRTAQYVGAGLSSIAVTFVMSRSGTDPTGSAAARGLGAVVGSIGVLLLLRALTVLLAHHRRRPA